MIFLVDSFSSSTCFLSLQMYTQDGNKIRKICWIILGHTHTNTSPLFIVLKVLLFFASRCYQCFYYGKDDDIKPRCSYEMRTCWRYEFIFIHSHISKQKKMENISIRFFFLFSFFAGCLLIFLCYFFWKSGGQNERWIDDVNLSLLFEKKKNSYGIIIRTSNIYLFFCLFFSHGETSFLSMILYCFIGYNVKNE